MTKDNISDAGRDFCNEHKWQCSKITNANVRLDRHDDQIGNFMKTRTILAVISLISAAFLSMGSYSVYINKMAINGSQSRHEAQHKTIAKVVNGQHNLQVDITRMEGVLHEVQTDVDELKQEVRELRP